MGGPTDQLFVAAFRRFSRRSPYSVTRKLARIKAVE
jgi:hypothetical protein